MSNFLENQPLQLAPYRGLPTELYAKIGEYKQDQYDQGVQRVQGAIDSIAGIDVSRDIDKQYLNQKVNEITSKINGFAGQGQDWANKSLVGNAQSLAYGLGRDKNIQAAVFTTSKIKQATTDLEAAKKEGKSSAYTEYNLAKQINAYQKMALGETANISYSPYSDTHKKIMDIIGKITKSSNESDNAFTMNSAGEMVLSDAIVRGKFAGVSPKQIQAAIYAGLDGNDLHQLSMEGEYNYANQNADQLKATITRSHQSDITDLADKRKIISDRMSSLTDVGEKSKLADQLSQLDEQIDAVKTDNQDYMDRIDKGDLDGVRGNYHITKTLRGFGNAFSYSETSQTYQSNPMAQIAMQRSQMQQEYSLASARMAQENNHFMLTYSQKERFHKDDQESSKGTNTGGGLGYALDQKDLPDVNIQNFQAKTDSLKSGLDAYDKDYLAKNGNKDQAWLEEQRKAYDKNPSSVPVSVKDFFEKRSVMEKEVYGNQQLITQLNKEADQKVGTIEKMLPKDAKPISFNLEGKQFYFTPEEMANFNDSVTSGKPLTQKESTLARIHELSFDPRMKDEGVKKIASEINYYYSNLTPLRDSLLKKRQDYINGELAKRTGESQRTGYTFPTGKAELLNARRGDVASIIARAKDAGQGLGDGVDIDKVTKLNADDQTSYHLVTKGKTAYGDSKYWMQLVGKDGTIQNIPLSIQDKRSLYGTQFEDGAQEQFSPIKQALNRTNNGSTNYVGTSDPIAAAANPYLHNTDFASVKNFSVKGDIYNQNGKYGLVLYIVDPYHGNKLQRVEYNFKGGLMDEAQINQLVPSLTDNHIYQLLNGEGTEFTAEKLKELQEKNKKAF